MNPLITVFLGIYNGSEYLSSLKEQIIKQTSKAFKLVAVDNCSEDNSWNELQNWKREFGDSLTIYRNEQNLGGGGSLEKALKSGLITTPWFAMMHQDDYYKEDHIETLIKEIENSPSETVGICTLLGSMNNEGVIQPTPPRAAWLIEDPSRINSFLINLRVQAFSFPTAAVKTEVFEKSFAHWHSPSFSDTEITLNLLTHGNLRYIKKETILYRENPRSESHVINSFESTIGASLGLTRVLASEGFRNLLKIVKSEERSKFFLELISGIENRVPESSMSNYLKVLAAEECCYAWNYLDLESTKFLSETYLALGSRFTSEMLAKKNSIQSTNVDHAFSSSLRMFSNQLGTSTFGRSTIRKKSGRFFGIFSKLPLPLKMRMFKIYVKLRSIKQPDYYWNVFWK